MALEIIFKKKKNKRKVELDYFKKYKIERKFLSFEISNVFIQESSNKNDEFVFVLLGNIKNTHPYLSFDIQDIKLNFCTAMKPDGILDFAPECIQGESEVPVVVLEVVPPIMLLPVQGTHNRIHRQLLPIPVNLNQKLSVMS